MTGGQRILVVDDDVAIVKLVSTVLGAEGYAVSTARDGLAALQAVDREKPELVIADIMMPQLDGLELVEGLRHHPDTNALPVIFITASDDPIHFAKSINLKARQFISKPFTSQELLEKVRRVLGPAAGN